MDTKLNQLLSEYGSSHQNSTNKLIHWIFVPLIMISIIGMLVALPYFMERSWYNNWGAIAILLVLFYYLKLSLRLALVFIFIGIFILGINWSYLKYVSWNNYTLFFTALTIFIISWMFQFYGHKIEGKKPSFLKDLQFLLIGPAWIINHMTSFDEE